jgi:hypothetical protein
MNHGHSVQDLNTNLTPKFLFYFTEFRIIAIVYKENIIIQREVYNILSMGPILAPIRCNYYTFEITSINEIDIIVATDPFIRLSYLSTMDVVGNSRIYELVSFDYLYYHSILNFFYLGITG